VDTVTKQMTEISVPDEAVQKFASSPHLAGWYHNPYACKHPLFQKKADSLATKIAEQYIELFTEALRRRGLMPFCGVEINFDSHSAHDQASNAQAAAVGNFGGIIGINTSETKIVYRLSQIGHWLMEQQARAYISDSSHAEAFEYAEKVLESPKSYSEQEIKTQKYFYKSLLEDAQKKSAHSSVL